MDDREVANQNEHKNKISELEQPNLEVENLHSQVKPQELVINTEIVDNRYSSVTDKTAN